MGLGVSGASHLSRADQEATGDGPAFHLGKNEVNTNNILMELNIRENWRNEEIMSFRVQGFRPQHTNTHAVVSDDTHTLRAWQRARWGCALVARCAGWQSCRASACARGRLLLEVEHHSAKGG